MTSGARFHADYANLRVRMVQVTACKSSEILCCWLTGKRDPVSKSIRKRGLRRAWCNIRRVANIGIFSILLRRNITSAMHAGEKLGTYWSIGLCLCHDALAKSYVLEYVWDWWVLFPV